MTVKSPDTDVAMLACYFSHSINAALYFWTGTKSRARILDITKMGINITKPVCEALVGMYAFTGCDSTNAFSGRGKKIAFQLISREDDVGIQARRAMQDLGQSFQVLSDESLERIESFTCKMYGKFDAMSINDIRYGTTYFWHLFSCNFVATVTCSGLLLLFGLYSSCVTVCCFIDCVEVSALIAQHNTA